MPARWEDDTLPRASVPSPADQEDRGALMARIGQRHREAVRTSRSEELHARLAQHAKAVAAIEADDLHTISVFCTKGRHRSVSLAEALRARYYPRAEVKHLTIR